ncbi:hypothetical protein [Actinomadura gamaensis]|uniref:Uncharacterized protein n=1 Tax=Actinomadura gamaensis TaxID=1763541 RepID=A0ABV9U9D1_9ACTN
MKAKRAAAALAVATPLVLATLIAAPAANAAPSPTAPHTIPLTPPTPDGIQGSGHSLNGIEGTGA